jgi:hypothetical protein
LGRGFFYTFLTKTAEAADKAGNSLQYGFPLTQVWLRLTAIIRSESPPIFLNIIKEGKK